MIGRRILPPHFSMGTFKLNPDASVILVDAELKGPERSHKIRMIVDTGASFTLINQEVLAFVGYDLARSKRRSKITTASGIEYVPFLEIRRLEALAQSVNNLEVCGHTLPPDLPAEGLLGLNFLRHFNVHFDFIDGSLRTFSKHAFEKIDSEIRRGKLKRFSNVEDFLIDLKK